MTSITTGRKTLGANNAGLATELFRKYLGGNKFDVVIYSSIQKFPDIHRGWTLSDVPQNSITWKVADGMVEIKIDTSPMVFEFHSDIERKEHPVSTVIEIETNEYICVVTSYYTGDKNTWIFLPHKKENRND